MFQFPGFPSMSYVLAHRWLHITAAGFLHSDICGSMDICSSPQLFAACHVLLRLPVPRHPPCALCCLTNFTYVRVQHRISSIVFTLSENLLVFLFNNRLSKLLLPFPVSEKLILSISLSLSSFDTLFSFQGAFWWTLRFMVENKGFEPLTPCVQGRCSPSWANSP